MFVEVNQMTGMPVADDMVEAGIDTAKTLKAMSSDKLQATAQELGFDKTKFVVAEMLYGLLPEQAVAVAMDILQAEQNRMVAARTAVPRGEPFLED